MEQRTSTIECIPGVQGGEPVIAGTRTPVRSVVEYSRVYDNDLAQVQQALRHLTRDQIQAALEYYAEHRAKIDAEIASQDEAFEEIPTI